MACELVETIEEVNDLYDYQDEIDGGAGDADKVSCGQDQNYNELKYIYKNKIKKDYPFITEEQAAEALCICCEKLDNPRYRNKFYKCLNEELGISIK